MSDKPLELDLKKGVAFCEKKYGGVEARKRIREMASTVESLREENRKLEAGLEQQYQFVRELQTELHHTQEENQALKHELKMLRGLRSKEEKC